MGFRELSRMEIVEVVSGMRKEATACSCGRPPAYTPESSFRGLVFRLVPFSRAKALDFVAHHALEGKWRRQRRPLAIAGGSLGAQFEHISRLAESQLRRDA